MNDDKKIENNSKQRDIVLLKEWLDKQPHLPKDIDEEFLTAFVYGTKSLEIAKNRLDKYCTIRGRFPKLFQNALDDILDSNFRKVTMSRVYYLPKHTAEGYCLLCFKFIPGDIDQYSHTQTIRRVVMMMELGIYYWPKMTGICLIVDIKDIPKSYLAKTNPSIMAGYFSYFQNAYPIKLKKFIIFNAPSYGNLIVNFLVKPFMKPKLFQRVNLTDEDHTILTQHCDIENWPCDYGGKEASIIDLDEEWYKKLVEHRDWFKKNSNLMSDETKRPPDEEDTYGVQGTFRALGID